MLEKKVEDKTSSKKWRWKLKWRESDINVLRKETQRAYVKEQHMKEKKLESLREGCQRASRTNKLNEKNIWPVRYCAYNDAKPGQK